MFLYKQVFLKEHVEVRDSLKIIYGVGNYKSFLVCVRLGFSYPFSADNLNHYNFLLISCFLDEITWLEYRIKQVILQNIDDLIYIESYKGFRHRDGLPCRGQRTRSNARSCKSKKY